MPCVDKDTTSPGPGVDVVRGGQVPGVLSSGCTHAAAGGVQADPHHGERWCQIRKNPLNAHKPFEALMKLLVLDLETRPDKEV